jgi:hypothetical protein
VTGLIYKQIFVGQKIKEAGVICSSYSDKPENIQPFGDVRNRLKAKECGRTSVFNLD